MVFIYICVYGVSTMLACLCATCRNPTSLNRSKLFCNVNIRSVTFGAGGWRGMVDTAVGVDILFPDHVFVNSDNGINGFRNGIL